MSTTTTVKLYLAPANHYNAYCIAGYNEKDAVRTACKACAGQAVRLRRHSGLSHHRIRRQPRLQRAAPRRPPR